MTFPRINIKSIGFRTGVIYFFMTLFNISIFVLMVFENQLDLIGENAILSSQQKASSLHFSIDKLIGGSGTLSVSTINEILKEASKLGIGTITVFSEAGKVFVAVKNQAIDKKEKADNDELKMINMAITKKGFEDKLYYHKVYKKERLIDLYIPFTYEEDKIGVAAIRLEMRDVGEQMKYLYRQCILIGIFILLLHIAFASFFAKMILMPIRKLNEATHSIAAGNLDIRVPIVGDDEIGRLASSFNEMSVAVSRMRDEAKGANPLTGLPGNITIAKYIDDGLSAGRMVCVLYCDLDNFKAYNDKYGFTKGDEAILYTRDCLIATSQRKDMQDIFVGHEGGDDFVVVCDYPYWETFAKSFITTFDRGIYQFYNSVDARNGFIESINRSGERQRFPLMSVSIAVVSNKMRPFRRHAEMIQVAAEVKKYVKRMDGSCYAIDRRQGPVSATGPAAPMQPGTMPPGPHPQQHAPGPQQLRPSQPPFPGQQAGANPAGARPVMPQPPYPPQQVPPQQQAGMGPPPNQVRRPPNA